MEFSISSLKITWIKKLKKYVVINVSTLDSGYVFKSCGGRGMELGPGFQGLLYISGKGKKTQKCFASFHTPLGKHGVLQITGFLI